MASLCISPDCGKDAGLHCPTCIKLGIKGSYFCDQDCFKSNWKEHKKVHELAGEFVDPFLLSHTTPQHWAFYCPETY